MALIAMKVEALDEYCACCPELEIDVDATRCYAGNDIVEYQNRISCIHYNKCLQREQYRKRATGHAQ